VRLISEEQTAEKKRKPKDAEVEAARLHSFSSWEERATHTLQLQDRRRLWLANILVFPVVPAGWQ